VPGNAAAPIGFLALIGVVSVLALAVSIVALIVVGAQGDDQLLPAGGGPSQTVAVELSEFHVEPDRIEIARGTHLFVDVTNRGELAHDLNLEGEMGTDRIQPGDTATADFGVIETDTEAWCTVPGHKENGMVLTIVALDPAAHPPPTSTPAASSTTAPPAGP
jgi:nitrite reductase (NO-forming)